MSDTVHFQWQNQHLLRTIYPLREMKLRDFLVFYFEFEIWEQYKSKTPDDVDVKLDLRNLEREEAHELRKVHDDYHKQLEFFFGIDLDFGLADRDKPITEKYIRRLMVSEAVLGGFSQITPARANSAIIWKATSSGWKATRPI